MTGRITVTVTRAVGRLLLAAVFIAGGWRTLTAPGPRVKAAAPLLARARGRLPWLPSDEALVRANAAVHVGAGLLLAAGVRPRRAAQVLALSLVPTTAAGHPFWDAGGGGRSTELIQVVKNAGVAGGLLLVIAGGQAPRGSRR